MFSKKFFSSSKKSKKIKTLLKKRQKQRSALRTEIYFGKINLVQKMVLAEHISIMLKSGLVISEALEIAVESNKGKLKKILNEVLKSVESGSSLADAFDRYKEFKGLFVNIIRAGELSGTLDKAFANLALQLKKENELVSKIRGAMIYPSVVLSAAFLMAMGVSFFILPRILPLFSGLKVELPLSTKILIAFSKFVQNHKLLLFFLIIGFISSFFWLIKQKFTRPFTHYILIKLPIIKKIIINVNLARFSGTLSVLLKSGLNINEALAITKDTLGNVYYQKAIDNITNRINKGSNLSYLLAERNILFPTMLIKMVKVGEESGRLEEVLEYLSEFYEIEVQNATKSLTTAIEPLLLLFIGLIVGWLAISIITPIYKITGSMPK